VRYLVGTPKGSLTKLEKDLATKDWQQVKDDVHVKLLPRDGELYVLARSLPRRCKESAMRRKKLKAYSTASLFAGDDSREHVAGEAGGFLAQRGDAFPDESIKVALETA